MRVINDINDKYKIDYLSQRDPRWATVKIGNTDTLVGRMGCLITCLSMLTQYFNCYQLPDEIAKNVKNFTADSIAWINLNFPTFSFRWREGSLFSEEPVDMDLIKAYMKDPNKAVVLEVANHSHWVLALWETFDQDILAIDPWTGETCEVFKKYKNITGAGLFVKGKPTSKMKPQAPLYN
jgi:hypothetical protein